MTNFLTLVTLSSVLVAVMSLQAACAGEAKVTFEEANCLLQMNEARNKAGFSPLTQATDPKDKVELEHQTRAQELCEGIAFEPEQTGGFLGHTTIAISIQTGEHVDCEGAVKEWKAGVNKFPSLPPPYTKDKEPYTSSGALSLVALFNPDPNPAADCLFLKCPAREAIRNDPAVKAFSALVCATTPPALKDGEAPFTQEQWDKIKAAVFVPDSPSGTTAAAPTFVVLMAVALGVFRF